jgi:hypothetical protein
MTMKTKRCIFILASALFSIIALSRNSPCNSQAYLSDQNVPWWNENWNHRWLINITNPSANRIYGYQLNIQLNFTNLNFAQAKADGSDLRFIYYNSTDASQNELNYWIKSWNSTAWKASIWIMVPYIPANETITIYMYYGNSNAESHSNFDTVFQKLTADEYTVALWRFDEGGGNKTYDASKYGNHGFLYNTTWNRDATFSTGSSLELNGNNSYVEVPYSASLKLVEAFTIEAWVKPNDTYNGQFVLVKKSSPYWGFNYALGIGGKPGGANALDKVWFSYYSVEDGQRYIISNITLESEKWYHITGVKEGYQNWLYVNSIPVAHSIDANQTPIAGDQPLYIGAFLAPGYGIATGFFNGTIDEARILNRALTAPEVKADYEHRKYVFPEPLVTVKPLHLIELTVIEPKTMKIGGTATFSINVTSGYDRAVNLSLKVLNNSQIIFTLNATKISETIWRTTEWDTTKLPEATYQLQAEVLDISGNTLTINLTQIQVEQSTTYKILTSLSLMIIPISSIIIITIPLLLVLKGFKPKWYHFLFFPALFIILMATYDALNSTWENIFSTNPWASTALTLSIVTAMFILWTTTLKEEKDQENAKEKSRKENTNRISDSEIK